MGKMRQTRRAMKFAFHKVDHITGVCENMKCLVCGYSVKVGTTKVEQKCNPTPKEG